VHELDELSLLFNSSPRLREASSRDPFAQLICALRSINVSKMVLDHFGATFFDHDHQIYHLPRRNVDGKVEKEGACYSST
jgi:hypothetical protein